MSPRNVLGLSAPLLALAISAGDAAEVSPRIALSPHVYEAADGSKVDSRFGVLAVPENRSVPAGATIEIAFVLFPTTAKQPGPPIVYIPGGPGGSGIDSARSSRFPLFMALREFGDVIALDPRGGRRSRPFLLCHETLDYPLAKPPSWDGYLAAMRSGSEDCAWFWRELQRVDLGGYNVNEAADDLEDLRRALGADRLNLWAISHGTHIAMTAMRRHPQGIGRAILAGLEGPDHTLKLPALVQKHLEDVGDLVARDPSMKERIPSLTALIEDVLERYDREPVTVAVEDPRTGARVPVTVNKFVLQLYTAGNIGTSTIGDIPAIYHAARQGDVASLAAWWLKTTREPIGNAMSYAMDCASGATAARLQRIANEAPRTLLGRLSDYSFPDVCGAWSVPDLGDAFREPVRFDRPVLFISGTLDGRTPVSNVDDVRPGFPDSVHLILEGAVHSDPLFLSSPRIAQTMLSFLRGETLPREIEIGVPRHRCARWPESVSSGKAPVPAPVGVAVVRPAPGLRPSRGRARCGRPSPPARRAPATLGLRAGFLRRRRDRRSVPAPGSRPHRSCRGAPRRRAWRTGAPRAASCPPRRERRLRAR